MQERINDNNKSNREPEPHRGNRPAATLPARLLVSSWPRRRRRSPKLKVQGEGERSRSVVATAEGTKQCCKTWTVTTPMQSAGKLKEAEHFRCSMHSLNGMNTLLTSLHCPCMKMHKRRSVIRDISDAGRTSPRPSPRSDQGLGNLRMCVLVGMTD